jgi:hypothetical protein
MSNSMIEYFGYIGSFFVALSLLMSNVYKLRIINFIGAIIFVIYGYIIKANAVWLVNFFIACVDFYYIIQLKTSKNIFRFIKLEFNDIIRDFINFYSQDIKRFFPNFEKLNFEELNYYLIIRNFVIVGIFAYRVVDDENLFIEIDYIVKEWRDFKNAKNFFRFILENPDFKGKKFITETTNKEHIDYLLKIGFRNIENNIYQFSV